MTHQNGRDRSLDTLTALAHALAGEFRLQPLLERILRSAVELLHSPSGSLCLVDEQSHTYHKEIDLDAGCEIGRPLSLDEGMTGLVVRSGGPVILERYADVPRGHLDPAEPRYHRGVIGVPIILGPQLIGALVVFAGENQRFTSSDARLLEEFASHAAIAIANSRVHAVAEERTKQAAVAAERERSMQEVHDTFGRGLATVMLRLQAALRAAPSGSEVAGQLVAAPDRGRRSTPRGSPGDLGYRVGRPRRRSHPGRGDPARTRLGGGDRQCQYDVPGVRRPGRDCPRGRHAVAADRSGRR